MDDEPRFYVLRMQGNAIDPGRRGSTPYRSHPTPCAYYVHNRAYCGKAIAVFPSALERAWVYPGSNRDALAKARAEAKAAELNAKHAALEAA